MAYPSLGEPNFASQPSELQIILTMVKPSPEPPNRQPRMHNVVPSAKAYIAALKNALLGRGGTILCNARVTSLMREEGRVVGVRATIDGEPREFRATRGVILAAGDYANSPELIAKHKGPRFANIEGINPLATGDGHRLAAEVGAPLVNMDITYGPELRFVAPVKEAFHQRLPVGGRIGRLMGAAARLLPRWLMSRFIKRLLVTWQHPEDALLADGAILLNQHGDRFTNELECPQREIDAAEQPDKVCYLLLGERLIKRYSAWPHFISTAPDIAYAYVADYQRLRPDVTTSAATLEELAARRKLDPTRLAAAVEAFNRYATAGDSDAFGRTGDAHLLSGPWVLLGPAKAYFTTTEGGARVDQDLRVLDSDGTPIPGLFAVGQNGLGGMILWGHGLHIAWAMTSGRLAGKSVMGRRHDDADPRIEGKTGTGP